MLRKVTRAEVEKIIKNLDTRTSKFDADDYNYVMDMGYAELSTIVYAFSNEEVVDLDAYYDTGETKLTLDIEEDVSYIYDLYLTSENQTDLDRYPHGIKKITNENAVYKDSRQVGRVHVDLTNAEKYLDGFDRADNCVIKYAFTPTHTTEDIFVDQPTMLAMRDAFGAALYNRLNDVEKEGQKRASLQRTALAITPIYPNDYRIPMDSNIPEEGRIVVSSMFKGLDI